MSRTHLFTAAVVSLVLSTVLAGCANKEQANELAALKAQEAAEQANLANFDDLDFNVFTGQKWDELSKSHSKDIIVHWPDGHTTAGIDTHIVDLKGLFAYIPDARIKEHPIKIAQGEWTAVTSVFEGTFTQPMPIGNGQTIAPTGKAFRLDMVTLGRWKDGVMVEEWLFWDNQALMKQTGLAQ